MEHTPEFRLDALRIRHDRQERDGKMQQASQRRCDARILCKIANLPVPEWAHPRDRGGVEMDSYLERHELAMQEREEADKKAADDFYLAEDNFRDTAEWELGSWYREHGGTFFDYLNNHPNFASMVVWDALRRLSVALSESNPVHKHHVYWPLPCPLPPECGRAAFLATLPPGTPDHAKSPGGRQVLQDDLII